MADTGSTHVISQSFQSIEQVDESVNLTDHDIHDIIVEDVAVADDYDVWNFSRYDDEADTPRKNEIDKNFEDFNGEHINGKTFDTQEAAYEFYNQYALLNGFGIRKHNAHKIRATGAIFRMQFVCNKQGFKKLDDKRLNENEKRRRDLRTSCEAMMQSLVADLNNEGLKPSQITRVVNVMKPSEEADITPRQCYSIIRVERKNNVGKECYGIIKHFQEKAALDDSYYFSADLARDGSLRSVFWTGYQKDLPSPYHLLQSNFFLGKAGP
ncbi:hypothetical protein RJ640_000120 [Escallonia rubra]|uniref:FAR1 domain-containing protein n=1 Tax=Escallonia rubra TaxID=112253 RepID=A0AA88UCV4_9ASTE|nr:hypothetical protein RJ640_000120 [Escallonia rubra]